MAGDQGDRDRISEIADRLADTAASVSGPELHAAFESQTAGLSGEDGAAIRSLVEQRQSRRLEQLEAREVEIDEMDRALSTDAVQAFDDGVETLIDMVAAEDRKVLRYGIARLVREDPEQAENALLAAFIRGWPRELLCLDVAAVQNEWTRRVKARRGERGD